MDKKELYKKAEKRVQDKLEFYQHLTAYIVANSGLIFINLYFTPGDYWFKFPLLGWGIGIFCHWLKVFGPINSQRMKNKMMEKEINRHKNDDN